jgi:hypothetical protein
MATETSAAWGAVIRVGGLPVDVAAAWAGPAGWGAGVVARLTGVVEASREGPPASGRAVLAPRGGSERAYLTMAAALAADDLVGLVSLPDGTEFRLRSLGEALLTEWGRAASAEDARGFTEPELAGALMVLRAMPRRLPARTGAPATAARAGGPGGSVVDLMQVRRARRRPA